MFFGLLGTLRESFLAVSAVKMDGAWAAGAFWTSSPRIQNPINIFSALTIWIFFYQGISCRALWLKNNTARDFKRWVPSSKWCALGRLPSDPADSGTWSQLVLCLAEAPSKEVGLRFSFGLMEHNLDLMIHDLRGNILSISCSVASLRRSSWRRSAVSLNPSAIGRAQATTMAQWMLTC